MLNRPATTLTSLQVPDLGPLRRTAVHAGALDSGGGAELEALLLNLHSQLSCGSQHENNGPVARRCDG